MEAKWSVVLTMALMLVLVNGDESSVKPVVKIVKGQRVCQRPWECSRFSTRCFGFWDYRSFITASADYQPDGFGTTGGKQTGMKEVAAFLGHVGSKTSCGYGVATGGPLAWGLCYNKEPLLMNYNYGKTGEALKVDLLNHPEYIEQNATLAFKAAIWRWMTPTKQHQPSAHDVFVGNWKRTKNDTLNKRVPGFGTTMNVLYGDSVCGQGDSDSMNNIISHYLYYLDLMVVGREEAGPHEVLSCGEQVAFNPSSSSS
ncbi:hypothetical protein I3760_01G137000 [Carya illinoinensis]|nr:hypothetical protein I3760_01G137000 [Carya illinoinensis]